MYATCCSSVWLGNQTLAVARRADGSGKHASLSRAHSLISATSITSFKPASSVERILLQRVVEGRNSKVGSSSSSTALRFSVREIYELSQEIILQGRSAALGVEEGPIELPPAEIYDPLAIPETTPLQAVASILLTGAITVLLIRAVRRRSKRAKEMKFRSTGEESAKKSIKEQAKEAAAIRGGLLTKAAPPEVEGPKLNPLQTLLGAVMAAIIALVLYKFTTTVEAGFSDKAVSSNYSIRNLTITVRTIITGICYLATFVFAANSIGLTLYSLQLALNLDPPSSPTNDSIDKKRELLSDSPSSEEERSSEKEQR
ncbi:unnamed protein product [Sphagnum troendelagicum]|uniref:Transmembrane protein n=1 Tax=Sphagnum troendelagicum TaxID=128251 RepID=A0ABP0TKH3_9BRYO